MAAPSPISKSMHPFSGLSPLFRKKFHTSPQVTQFLEGLTPPPPLIRGGGVLTMVKQKSLPLPLLPYESQMFMKENPDRRKKDENYALWSAQKKELWVPMPRNPNTIFHKRTTRPWVKYFPDSLNSHSPL